MKRVCEKSEKEVTEQETEQDSRMNREKEEKMLVFFYLIMVLCINNLVQHRLVEFEG